MNTPYCKDAASGASLLGPRRGPRRGRRGGAPRARAPSPPPPPVPPVAAAAAAPDPAHRRRRYERWDAAARGAHAARREARRPWPEGDEAQGVGPGLSLGVDGGEAGVDGGHVGLVPHPRVPGPLLDQPRRLRLPPPHRPPPSRPTAPAPAVQSRY